MPIFFLAVSVLLGLLSFFWPNQPMLWVALFGLCHCSNQKKWIIAGFVVGFLRIGFEFSLFEKLAPVLPTEKYLSICSEPFSKSKFGEIRKLSSVGQQNLSEEVYFYSSKKPHHCDRGKLRAVATRDIPGVVSKERRQSRSNLFFSSRWAEKRAPAARLEANSLPPSQRLLLYGDYSALSQKEWAAANFLGVSHLFVISGLHFGVLLFLLSFFLRGFKRVHFQIALSAMSLGFAIFFEFSIPVTRVLLVSLFLIWLPRLWPGYLRMPLPERLSLVALPFMLLCPIESLSKSFCLSFGASWAILRSLETKPKWLVTLAAFVFVAPILKCFHNDISFLSPILNLLFVPSFLLVVISSLVFRMELGFDLFTKVIVWASHQLSRSAALEGVSETLTLCILGLGFLYLNIKSWRAYLALFLAVALCLLSRAFNGGDLEIQFFDVGQGDAISITEGGEGVFIDGGARVTELALEAIRSSRVWVITHFDEDHSGIYESLGDLGVSSVLVPRWDPRITRPQRAEVVEVQAKELSYRFKNYCAVLLSFPGKAEVQNKDSVVFVLYQCSRRRIVAVLTGDLPRAGERKLLRWLKGRFGEKLEYSIDLLKAGHHGSKTSTSEELLAYLRPRELVLQSGRHNRYRFPHPSVLDRAERWGAKLVRTDALGCVRRVFDFE